MRGPQEPTDQLFGRCEQLDVAHTRVRRRRHERVRLQICVRQYVQRVVVTTALGLAGLPTICHAQESGAAPRQPTPRLSATSAPSLSTTNGIIPADEPIDVRQPSISQTAESRPTQRLGVMLPLYASFATLQTLDAHSTMRALQNGGVESNPLLRDFASQPAALFAMKAGVTASTILLTEKLRSKNRVAAIALMAALDSFYGIVVVHNYRTTP